jgi:hypothetical protein
MSMPDAVHEAVVQAVIRAETPLEFMLAAMRDVNQPMPFRAEIAKAAAPYVHAKLASTEINVANKLPEETGPIQEQWDDLIRRMIAAGAISLVPDDLMPEPQPVLGIAKPNGRGALTVNKDANGQP